MRSARLDMALDTGALVLPKTGAIAVLRPRAGDDLAALGKDRVVVLTGFKPDHDHFAGLGFRVAPAPPYAVAVVCLPRARAEAHAMLAQAVDELASGGIVVIDGQKTDGVDTILKDCRARGLALGPALSKAHGKLACGPTSPLPASWAAAPREVAGGFVTLPGVFSADGPDRGSVLLAAALPADLPGRVGDLGAGWGFLARAILQRGGVKQLDLVEAEAVALDCARRNITDPRAVFHWADATTFRPERPWNVVVMNPPYHIGRSADPGLGQRFLQAAHRGLAPDGALFLVANRHLPYDKVLAGLFHKVEEIAGDPAFRLTRASHPIRSR